MADKIFIDTNILIYAAIVSSPFYEAARLKLQFLQDAQHELWISRQVIREYLTNISKLSPAASKVVSSVHLSDFRGLMEDFSIADENEQVTRNLFYLLSQMPCGGKQVHDANIVATMMACDIKSLLTHNVSDFTRFSSLIRIEPLI